MTTPSQAFRPALAAFFLLLLAALNAPAQTVVTGTGRGPGDEAACREIALTEALRDAVRRGAGVEVAGLSRMSDYALDFDQVLATAVGLVRDYRVLEAGYDQVGDYVVKLQATVVPGTPEKNQRALIRTLIRLKGAPRLVVTVRETVNDQPRQQPAAAGPLAAHALELGFQVADAGPGMENARGNTPDLLLRADIAAAVGAGAPVYGQSLREVSFSLDLAALRPDSGETVARFAPPGQRATSSAPTDAGAMAEALRRTLAEGVTDAFFRQILARWVVELDLGQLVRVEAVGLDRADLDALAGKLRSSQGINGVFVRSFNPAGGLLDVESRLATGALCERLEKLAGGSTVEARPGAILLRAGAGANGLADSATPAPGGAGQTGTRGWPLLPVLLAVAGLAALAGGWRLLKSPKNLVPGP